ncbi:MAG: proprotein convertase P-domain-containing protein [Parasphingorhabdus sp.]
MIYSSSVDAQTVTQYTISEPGGSNDIVAARTCGTGTGGTGGSPLVKNFSVGTNFVVSDVDLGVLASHSYRTDIRVILQSPAGTRAILINGSTSGGNTNLNVRLSDESSPTVNSGSHGNDNLTPTPNPPTTAYQRQLSPENPLTVFDGQNSIGTWRMEICDMFPSADDGNFLRADLWLTSAPTNFADLSLAKTVSNASPTSGTNITYTLSLTNSAASNQTAAATVSDLLPLGVTFVSASGYGTYNSGTGIWDVPSIAPGQTRAINIIVTVTAPASATVTNVAEVASSNRVDPDSTPNNGVTGEDDYASGSFTVAGSRTAGTPPSLTTVCSIANQILFDWNGKAWTGGSTNNSYTVTGIGSINFNITNTGGFYDDGSPAVNSNNTGGLAGTEQSLYENLQFTTQSQTATTMLTLPTAVPGLQFTVFDIDFATNDFADKLTVIGRFNGSTVMPTLTNGVANYVIGNVAIGDVGSGSTSANGNVVVTFTSPVDQVEIIYGNHTTAPADPDGQAISIHDINFCRPLTTMSVTKISSIISDPVSGTTNPKRIPGAIVEYCILISNSGSASAGSIVATDSLTGAFTYTPGTLKSGSNC